MTDIKDDQDGVAGVLTRDIDRRGFLKCMQWAGAGVVWSFAGGVPVSRLLGAQSKKMRSEDFAFVQISDSHIGFDKPANADVNLTFQAAADKINALAHQPDFILHTGDLSHLAKASEFDTLDQLLKGVRQKQVFYVPGEHDLLGDDGKQYMERFGKGTVGRGWQSFDHKGVHFIGLNNSAQLEGMGALGDEQIAWLKSDVAKLGTSTPVVVFAHIPLWAAYPEWGWATKDSAQALEMQRCPNIPQVSSHNPLANLGHRTECYSGSGSRLGPLVSRPPSKVIKKVVLSLSALEILNIPE